MKQLTEREIKDLLTPSSMPQPPADLAQRIKSEIPDLIVLEPATPGEPDRPARSPMTRARFWLMAASIVLVLGGGFLALRLQEQMSTAPLRNSRIAEMQAPESGPQIDASAPQADEAIPTPTSESTDPVLSVGPPGSEQIDTGASDVSPKLLQERRDSRLSRHALVEKQPEATPPTSPGQDKKRGEAVPQAIETRERSRITVAPSGIARTPAPAPPPEPAQGTASARRSEPSRRPAASKALEDEAGAPAEEEILSSSNIATIEESSVSTSTFATEAQPPPSVRSAAEPLDAPHGDMFFADAGTNPFIDTEDDALSTFGLDVDSGSYTIARRFLRDGHLPPREAVRVEEFINYFDYVSGSMAQNNRLGLVKQALLLLLDQLRPDDRIALVIYGSTGQVLIEPTNDRDAIRRGIERLRTGGSTNAEEGLALAYDLAARHARRGILNRVILCSDGVANVGRTSAGSILDRIRRQANLGIELTTVGFGMGHYNDVLMERLADQGNGRYAYVDTLDEARRVFVENLTGTLQTLAADARIQVELNPDIVTRYRLLGYENREIDDERFRDDTVDGGEIGVGHTVTALYELKLNRQPKKRDEIGTLRLRYGSIAKGEVVEVARTVSGADFSRRWEEASVAMRLTSLVAELAEVLKRSYWAKDGDLEDVFKRAQIVSAERPGDHDAADFVSLVGQAARAWTREAGR